MTDFVDDTDAEEMAAFEALGRRAGAELRHAAPEPALDELERSVRRRNATRVIAGTVGVALLLVVGWVLVRDHVGGDGQPVDQTPVPTVPLPVGAPGSWRLLSSPSDASDVVTSATWTGAEAIVFGMRGAAAPASTAHGYDVRRDSWRALARPPADLIAGAMTAWTGVEVLAADGRGHVYSFDPRANEWHRRAAPSDGVTWGENGGLTAVSPTGVLTRSLDAWWWYDEADDTWTAVGSSDQRFDDSLVVTAGAPTTSLDALTATEFVLAHYRDGSIQFAIFDADTGKWSPLREADSPTVTRGGPTCQAADGRLVCVAEGFGTLDGRVIDIETGSATPFSLGSHDNTLVIRGTPWFGHAWRLLLARTAEWEPLPTLDGVDGFSTAIWDGKELLMFGSQLESGEPGARFAAAYTPKVQP